MASLLEIINQFIFADIPSNAAYDLLKTVIQRIKSKNWEEIYLDAFEDALKEMIPQLQQYSKGPLIEIDRERLRGVISYDIGGDFGIPPFSRISDDEFYDSLANRLAEHSVLIIEGHLLSVSDYSQLVRNLVKHATAKFRQAIVSDEQLFRQEMLAENRIIIQILIYLKNKFDAMDQKIEKIDRLLQFMTGQTFEPGRIMYPVDVRPDEVSATSPLLIGLLLDASRSVFDAIEKTTRGSRSGRLIKALNILVEKAALYCRTPESEEVTPLLSIFLLGYGFGNLRSKVGNIISSMGIKKTYSSSQPAPTNSVRDLLSELAVRKGLPITPNIAELNTYWKIYRKSIEAQLFDAGLGRSVLVNALQITYDRFVKELSRPYYKYPILLIISDGQIQDGTVEEAKIVIENLRTSGVQIICGYVAPKNVIQPRTFFDEPDPKWPIEAQNFFSFASVPSRDNPITLKIFETAKERGWRVSGKGRLFTQINHKNALEELVDAVVSAVKD